MPGSYDTVVESPFSVKVVSGIVDTRAPSRSFQAIRIAYLPTK